MQSVVSVRGQTVIPKEIRKALKIEAGTTLHWALQNGHVVVYPMPHDPIAAMRGVLKDLPFSTADLLAERRAERDREEAQVEEMLRRWRTTS